MKKALNTEIVITTCFILFWLYAVYAKLSDFTEYEREMHSQVFGNEVTTLLLYSLPVVEIVAAALLVFDKTRISGFIASTLLMLSFTVYVGLAVFTVYRHTPCSCAGLFHFNWKEQFYFNLFRYGSSRGRLNNHL